MKIQSFFYLQTYLKWALNAKQDQFEECDL